MNNVNSSSRKKIKLKAVYLFSGILLALIAILFMLFTIFMRGVANSLTTPIEDIAKYPELRGGWSDTPYIQHFPLSIPINAVDEKFFYLPGFLQGGTIIQLEYSLPSEEINQLLISYRASANYVFHGGDTNIHANQSPGVPTYHTGDTSSFPDTFEILVFDAQPQGSPDFEWNHGYSYGVAIDPVNSTIVFWAEDW